MEQEKLAEKLERACSPTQEVDSGHIDLEIPADAQYSDTDPEPEVQVPPFSNEVWDSLFITLHVCLLRLANQS